jgi:alpha-N-arabinofuranosidase
LNGAFSVRDEVEGDRIGPEWMRIRASDAPWLRLAGGALQLEARPVALGSSGHPSYVGRRLQHHWASASTAVTLAPGSKTDRAGIAVLQNESHFYALSVAGGAVQLQRRAGEHEPQDGVTIASRQIDAGIEAPILLRIDARGDRYDFLYALRPGDWQMLAADQDGTILSTKSAGGFVGATVGLFARSAD